MADKFISAITDEAMQRVCYSGGGWELTPYHFIISSTDVLNGIEAYDIYDNVTNEAIEKLKGLTSADVNMDNGIWCELPFASLTQSSKNRRTLTHHIVIPATQMLEEKDIKTIYFIYTPHTGEPFLYAVAIAPKAIIFEPGVTQSFFFNFTLNNEFNQNDVEYVINYTYPQDIEDHNNSSQAHSYLLNNYLLIDGTREITGILKYSNSRTFTNEFQLVSKGYVDNAIQTLKTNNNLR